MIKKSTYPTGTKTVPKGSCALELVGAGAFWAIAMITATLCQMYICLGGAALIVGGAVVALGVAKLELEFRDGLIGLNLTQPKSGTGGGPPPRDPPTPQDTPNDSEESELLEVGR